VTTALIALATVASIAIVAQPAAATSAVTQAKLPPPPNTVHDTRIIGHIVRTRICTPGPPTLPAPSASTLAYLAEASTNEVQVVDEATGALVGTPITVGTSPKGAAYWQPAAGSTRDPLVIVTNSGSHSVTIIDAVTQTVVATISIPSGSGGIGVAASPMQPYAMVVDHQSGKVSIIDLTSYTDAGEIALTSTSNALASVAFGASGTYAYVTDPTDHKIFTLFYNGAFAPWFNLSSTYTNASYDPTGVATDLSSSSSSTLLVTDAQSASGHLLSFIAGASLSSPTIAKSYASDVPGAVSLSPGSQYGYVDLTDTNKVSVVTLSSGAAVQVTPNSSFTNLGAVALSADGSTLLSANTANGSVQGTTIYGSVAAYTLSADSRVWAIAPAPPVQDAWNVFVTIPGSGGIDVVNSGTGSIVQTITDTGGSPTAIAASPDGKYVYVANGSNISVIQDSLVSTTSNPIVATITGIQGTEPNTPTINALSVSPNGDSVVATDSANGAVYVVDTNPADGTSYRKVVNRIGLLGGANSTVVSPTGGIAFSADGLYAYATEAGVTYNTYDGVTVLQLASATTTGYTYDTTDEALQQGGTTMITPKGIAVNPNGEYAYVVGTDTTLGTPPWGLYKFPLQTNGQLANGSSTSPVWNGTGGYGVAFSPEDDSAFVTNTGTESVNAISEAYGNTSWTSAVDGLGGQIAVSPDGLYVATIVRVNTCGGMDGLQLLDAGTGTVIGGADLSGSSAPNGVAIAPQSSPQTVTTSELAGGASNPAESGIASGMNDVVTSGTPSDAPGASAGVDTATGAYSLSVDSMTVPDIGPSLDQTATYDSSRSATNSLLGYGWDYSYGMTASQNGTSCVVTVTFDDGATTTFNPTTASGSCASRTYQAPGWAQDTLTFASGCNGTDSCFLITVGATTKYYVDQTTGQLVKIKDLNGNTVSISWGSHSACSGATSTEPCQVTAADGIRTLTFSYPSSGSGTCPSGSHTCVVVTDPLGRTLTYVKDSAGNLIQIALSNTAVSGSTDQTANYALAYASGHVLDSWWDPQNNAADAGNTSFATDVTYTSGRVTQVTGPEIYSVAPLSTTAITPTTTITYEDFDSSTGDGTVLVQNPDFNQSNYEPGASQSLDTYANYQLVSSVQGYGALAAYDNGSTAPLVPINSSESVYPMRDDFNLMPSESMNALAGTTVPVIGTQTLPQYDNGVVLTTYDASGNELSSTDQSGNTTSTTYNQLNEPIFSADPLGNLTVNTYNSTGQLLTTSPPANSTGGVAETSNWYNSNGTICASRDAIETHVNGVLSSCVSAGSNATTYSYDSNGDQTLAAVTDTTSPSTVTSTTQSVYDVDGDVCATLSSNGYAVGALSGCPSSGTGYATVNLNSDEYNQPTKVMSSLTMGSPNTYATSYTCTDANGNTTASVGPLGTFSTCSGLSPTTSVDASFSTYDASGDLVQSISPLATSGNQGSTSTTQFDANESATLSLSPQGYAVWVANNSATLTPFESVTLFDDQGNQVSTAPAADNVASCVDTASNPCPDTSITTYDNQGQSVAQASAGNGESDSSPIALTTIVNPNGTTDGNKSMVGGGSTGVQETTQATYNAAGESTNSVTEHWNGTAWVTDAATSTAFAPDGSTCWTSQTAVTSPSCASPPSTGGTTTTNYYDLAGHVVAKVGPGGSGVVKPGGSCDPTAALGTYSINTSELCAFTTYSVYNEAGQLTEAIQPSLSSATSGYVAAGATTTYGYDLNGTRTSEVNPVGITITTTYDASNRTTGVSYSDSSNTISYAHNVDGTRSQMVDSTGTTTYSYDNAGRLSSVTDSNGKTVTYGYNQFDQVNCVSYPGFSHDCTSAGEGTNSPPSGDVTRNYDAQGRLLSVVDWNGDAFTYAYDCTGDVAWLLETPNSQAPSITPCQGASGSVPSVPTPPSGTTYVETQYQYSSGASGSLLSSETTSALTSSGSTSLLAFGSSSIPLAYDDSNNRMSVTPYVNGTAQTTDTYAMTSTPYDFQRRVPLSPEPSGWSTAYHYVNSSSSPFTSQNTVDLMGIDVQPAASSTYTGLEYAGNGELCWEATAPTASSSSPCGPPASPSSYESFSYDASGDRTGTTAHSFGTTSSLIWNQDTDTLGCVNTSGSTCTGPSSSQPNAVTFTYNADGLRMTASTWNSSTSSVQTADFTWGVASGLFSDGAFDYIYGVNPNMPIAQIDAGDSVTSELFTDTNSNVRGLVEVSTGAAHPYTLVTYTDYDAYGNPISGSGGTTNPGGLTNEVGTDPDSLTRFGFGGGYEDGTGLVYLVNRYYDPATGQFTSIDPLLNSTGSPFAYARDNPLSNNDPMGLQPTCFDHSKVFTGGEALLLGPGMYCWTLMTPNHLILTSDEYDITHQSSVVFPIKDIKISVVYVVSAVGRHSHIGSEVKLFNDRRGTLKMSNGGSIVPGQGSLDGDVQFAEGNFVDFLTSEYCPSIQAAGSARWCFDSLPGSNIREKYTYPNRPYRDSGGYRVRVYPLIFVSGSVVAESEQGVQFSWDVVHLAEGLESASSLTEAGILQAAA
jgi:RHS repeat-associated protein